MKAYLPTDVIASIGGSVIKKFKEIHLDPLSDQANTGVGCNGEPWAEISIDSRTQITIIEPQMSEENNILSLILTAQRTGVLGFPFYLKSRRTSLDIHIFPKCVVKKQPKSSYTSEATPRVWVIESLESAAFVGAPT